MENIKLPTEEAYEPFEAARQPYHDELTPRMERQPSRKLLTFSQDIEDFIEKSSSQRSDYKEALSQPAASLSHRERLIWLQKHRTTGLWVQCDTCNQWRFLAKILDRYELPKKWYCKMNPDPSYAICSVPEAPINVREEEDLIHNEYSVGSVVWAQLAGWPAWPAMTDDCPDTEQFYWLDGFSDIPTHYNVVFFDSKEVTRAWISPENMKPYTTNKNKLILSKTQTKYKKRLESAMKQADDALKLDLNARLAKHSFLARYKGPVTSPKKITNKDLVKYQKKIKRKFNVDITMEPIEDSNNHQIKTRKNVVLLGTPKKDKTRARCSTNDTIDRNDLTRKSVGKKTGKENIASKDVTRNTEGTESTTTTVFKQPNSMAVQIGSTAETLQTEDFDNDTSKTYVPEGNYTTQSTELTSYPTDPMEFESQDISGRITPKSDDFEFN